MEKARFFMVNAIRARALPVPQLARKHRLAGKLHQQYSGLRECRPETGNARFQPL
jgi:hypothetical protein